MMKFRWAFIVLTLLLVAAGCAKGEKVGDESLLNFKDEAQNRLGGRSPTPSPAAAAPQMAETPQKQSVGGGQDQQQAQQQQQQQRQQAALVISVNADTVGTYFDPSVATVTKDGKVTWVNRDRVARSVEADDGSFSSGSLAPGASWSYVATKVGKFNYHDGTRPYAVGQLEVIEG